MPRTPKSWAEKLHDAKGLPRIGTVDSAGPWGVKPGDILVIPAPLEVDALMKEVPKGKLTTINDLRAAIARNHHATIACPVTTGIFAWIAAHAAEEAAAASSSKSHRITPYWRTLKQGGELNPKYPGGPEAVAAKLRAEGHTVTRRGKRYFVADYEQALAALA
jgi:hypothetical protein